MPNQDQPDVQPAQAQITDPILSILQQNADVISLLQQQSQVTANAVAQLATTVGSINTNHLDSIREMQDLQAKATTQHAADLEKLTDAIKASSSNLGLPPDVIGPNKYPKIDSFDLAEASGDQARLVFFAHRNALSARISLHLKYREAVLPGELTRHGVPDADKALHAAGLSASVAVEAHHEQQRRQTARGGDW